MNHSAPPISRCPHAAAPRADVGAGFSPSPVAPPLLPALRNEGFTLRNEGFTLSREGSVQPNVTPQLVHSTTDAASSCRARLLRRAARAAHTAVSPKCTAFARLVFLAI